MNHHAIVWDMCHIWGHAYQTVGTTAEGYPISRCTRCGASYATWSSNGTGEVAR